MSGSVCAICKTRGLTGAEDTKIRIWSTLPILNAEAEQAGVPKKLCTLSMHSGPVLCVRWSGNGRWLASGSDDAIIMIWDLDPYAVFPRCMAMFRLTVM